MFVLSATVTFLCNVCCANPVTLVTEDYPPFNFSPQEGQPIVGISTDIIVEMMKRNGDETKIAIYPWKRALILAKNQANTCVYSTLRSADREND